MSASGRITTCLCNFLFKHAALTHHLFIDINCRSIFLNKSAYSYSAVPSSIVEFHFINTSTCFTFCFHKLSKVLHCFFNFFFFCFSNWCGGLASGISLNLFNKLFVSVSLGALLQFLRGSNINFFVIVNSV